MHLIADFLCVAVPGLPEHFIPFQQPNDTYHALSVSPSAMSKDEQAAFPEYTRFIIQSICAMLLSPISLFFQYL